MTMWVMSFPNFLKTKFVSATNNNNNAYRNYIFAWMAILVLVIISGIWIWLAFEMNKLMPHTFAWEMLLRTFGSSFSLECQDDSPLSAVSNWPPEVNCSPISHSIPCVSIIALMVLFITMVCAVICLLPVSFSTLDAAASGVRVSLIWHVCFLFVSLTVISYYYNIDYSSLRPAMLAAKMSSKIELTDMWNLTQITSECCGIDNYKDWDSPDGLYPTSCCKNVTAECNEDGTWDVGCLRTQEVTMEIYGTINFFLLMFEFLVSLYLCYLVEYLKSVWFPASFEMDRKENIELGTPLLK